MGEAIRVDTKRAGGRRTLRFETLNDALADAEALAAAERAGRLRSAGNWSLGQVFGHLAAWVGYAYDGLPVEPPRLVRWLMRPMKKRFLFRAMPAGVKIPSAAGGTFGTDVLSTDEGLERLRSAYARLKAEPPARAHPLFGRLTHEEWINGHLRHAELHLSFVRAE